MVKKQKTVLFVMAGVIPIGVHSVGEATNVLFATEKVGLKHLVLARVIGIGILIPLSLSLLCSIRFMILFFFRSHGNQILSFSSKPEHGVLTCFEGT